MDPRLLFFQETKARSVDIWVIPALGGAGKRRLYIRSAISGGSPIWTPGREIHHLLFRCAVAAAPTPGGIAASGRTNLSHLLGKPQAKIRNPANFRRDGRQLIYTKYA
jgi:hypothetical protein